MISYNQEAFIREAVLSALQQDYGPLEVIVSDDASSDGTREILQDLERQYAPRLRVILNDTNLGITGNSNAALEASHGEYVCIVGGDDILLPGKVRKQVEFMRAHPEAAISYHDAEVFDSETGRTMYYYNDRFNIHQGTTPEVIKRDFICAGTAMIDRRCLPPSGFDARVPHISDWMMWVDILARTGKQVLFMPGVYFRYRKHDQSYTSTNLDRVDYRALASALALARSKYPQHTRVISAREAELLVLLTVHSFRRRQALDYSYLRPGWRHVPFLPRGVVLMVRNYWVTSNKLRRPGAAGQAHA